MGAVVEEAQRASARGGVVDDFGHHRLILSEIQLVADAYLAGRLHKHIPELVLLVELSEEENLDTCACLFLVAVETCGKHHRVVEHHHISIVKIVDDLFEYVMGDLAGLAVDQHHAAFVTTRSGFLGYQLVRQFEFKLGKLHLLLYSFLLLFLSECYRRFRAPRCAAFRQLRQAEGTGRLWRRRLWCDAER